MRKVCIIQRTLPHYRVAFFRALHEALRASGIEMTLIYGQNSAGEVPVSVKVDFPWAIESRNIYLQGDKKGLVWQSALSRIPSYDLVVVEYAGRLLLNYPLLILRSLGVCKLAFWGHGKNFQAERSDGFRENFKRKVLTHVDWWFAYTDLSKRVVCEGGFPENKISTLNNTIDEKSFLADLESARAAFSDEFEEFERTYSRNVALYCGGMYTEKKIEFLVSACISIRERVPDFHFFWIGSGPDDEIVKQASARFSWMHYVGPLFKDQKLKYFLHAKLQLMPGLVGLAIIDSFLSEVPIVTTAGAKHSPEIDYLLDNINGAITGDDLQSYVDRAVHYLTDEDALRRLKIGCRDASQRLTLANMVSNFADGIHRALAPSVENM